MGGDPNEPDLDLGWEVDPLNLLAMEAEPADDREVLLRLFTLKSANMEARTSSSE